MPLVSSITIAGVLVASLVIPQAMTKDRYEYQDCILEHLANAKLDVANHFIAKACEEVNGSEPSKSIMTSERSYNECLSNHMAGV